MLIKFKNKILHLYKKYILKDHLTLEFSRWFDDNGDTELRFDYPLNSESTVFDLGGYEGDFAAEINKRYGCKVYVFEPVPSYFEKCEERFKNNADVICFKFGLSSKDEWLDINIDENASSFFVESNSNPSLRVELRSITDFINTKNITKIDLLKINIEGGEFEVLPELIKSTQIRKIKYLQIQFHSFINNAHFSREKIRSDLSKSHSELWSYDFVWESWKSNVL